MNHRIVRCGECGRVYDGRECPECGTPDPEADLLFEEGFSISSPDYGREDKFFDWTAGCMPDGEDDIGDCFR